MLHSDSCCAATLKMSELRQVIYDISYEKCPTPLEKPSSRPYHWHSLAKSANSQFKQLNCCCFVLAQNFSQEN